MNPKQLPKRISLLKWILGAGTITLIMLGGPLLAWIAMRVMPAAPTPSAAGAGGLLVVLFLLGLLAEAVGAALYGIAHVTHCLTLNFSKPCYPSFKKRLWIANLVVGLFLQMGFALMVAPGLIVLLGRFVPFSTALLVGIFLPFMSAQLLFIWLMIWAPLDRKLVARRLLTMGISRESQSEGLLIGISDPTRSSFKKLTVVEDDVGIIWLTNDRLIYRGDQFGFEIPHACLLTVERRADAGAISAYFGAVHVILLFRDSSGAERRIRLHSEGDWTMSQKAAALNRVADRLMAWKDSPSSDWHSSPEGFPLGRSI